MSHNPATPPARHGQLLGGRHPRGESIASPRSRPGAAVGSDRAHACDRQARSRLRAAVMRSRPRVAAAAQSGSRDTTQITRQRQFRIPRQFASPEPRHDRAGERRKPCTQSARCSQSPPSSTRDRKRAQKRRAPHGDALVEFRSSVSSQTLGKDRSIRFPAAVARAGPTPPRSPWTPAGRGSGPLASAVAHPTPASRSERISFLRSCPWDSSQASTNFTISGFLKLANR